MDILGQRVNQGWADVYPSVLQARVASELWEASFVAGFGASPALELRREGLLFWLAWFPGCARSSGGPLGGDGRQGTTAPRRQAPSQPQAAPHLLQLRRCRHSFRWLCAFFKIGLQGLVSICGIIGTLLFRASASGAPQCIRRCSPLGHRGYSNRRRSTSPVAR